MAEQLTVLIIGAGTKGAFGPVSHAEAFTKAGFKIAGFVDSDLGKAKSAADKWGGKAFSHIQDAAKWPVDVAVVATSDAAHLDVMKKLQGWSKLVFAEKPFTRDAAEAKKLLEAFRLCGQAVTVNYTRRFSPMFQDIQGLIRDGDLGDFIGGAGFYGNGLYHNGSHMIDMLQMLAGEVKVYGPGAKIVDAKHDDPSVYGLIEVGGSPFYLGIIPRPCVNAFDAILYFTEAAVRVVDVGRQIELSRTAPRLDFQFDKLYGEPVQIEDERKPMMVAVQNIKDHLTHGVPLLSKAEDAIRVLEICEALS
jgi:predicted dehydrogenase